MHRFQEYLWTDEVALQIITPSIKDGLQCELCFLLLVLHAEEDLWRLEQATAHPVLGCRDSLEALEPEGVAGN